MRIDGETRLLAHIGYPTRTFRAPLIYNPWFEKTGTNCAVVPMACPAPAFRTFLPAVLALENVIGAIVTMPHKIAAADLLDEADLSVRVCGACNAVRKRPDGTLAGAMFDGLGFVRGLASAGHDASGKSALVVGAGGVGSAIASALAQAGVRQLGLSDVHAPAARTLASRLAAHFPTCDVSTGAGDPAGYDIVVNATPLGARAEDPLPIDPSRLSPGTVLGDVILSDRDTRLVASARTIGCAVQVGEDMLLEQIPSYLEFFGLPVAPLADLRSISRRRITDKY